MATKMRIVGSNPGKNVFIQKYVHGKWEQKIITVEEFSEMMKNEYPKDWNVYQNSGTEKAPDVFFWDYGCTEAMIRRGESYIFQ